MIKEFSVNKFKFFLGVILLIIIFSTPVFGSELIVSETEQIVEQLGFLTLTPPIVAIVLAFITKNVIVSLFIGVLSGAFILEMMNYNFFGSLIRSFADFTVIARDSLADPWNAGLIMQVLTIGGFVFLLGKMGGTKAIAEALSKKAKNAKNTQFITWCLGLIVFFDDYANLLLVGPVMRPIFDKMKISREKLAFIIDSTAAPVAGLAIISTWIGLEVSLIDAAFRDAGIMPDDLDAFGVFIKTIPFRFYNIFMLIFVVLNTTSGRDFGAMYLAEKNARNGKNNLEVKNQKDLEELEPDPDLKLNIWNGLIPIMVLIVGACITFYINGYINTMNGTNQEAIAVLQSNPLSLNGIRYAFSVSDASIALFQAALFASIVSICMAVYQKIFTLSKAIDVWTSGMKSLVGTALILILAWSLSAVIKDLGTAVYLSNLLSDAIPMFLLPSIIFIFGGIISFSTGSSYGTMGILMPLTIPLAIAVQPEGVPLDIEFIIICTSAVLTGAIFGDHCSPISDTTILSSMGASCDQIEHVKTQMPYALFVASVTIIFGYIPAALGVSALVCTIVSCIVMTLFLYLVGKKVD